MMVATVSAQTIVPVYPPEKIASVSRISMASMGYGYVVTAVKNSAGNLEVNVWHDTGSALVPTGSATGDKISFGTAVAAVTSDLVVTAAFNTSRQLEVTTWQVSSNGSVVTQLHSETAEEQGSGTAVDLSVAIAAGNITCDFQNGDYCVFTAANTDRNLEVSEWGVSFSGVITPQGSIATGVSSVSEVAAAPVGDLITCCTSPYFVTAVKSGSDLELGGWSFAATLKAPDGVLTSGSAPVRAGAVGHVSVAVGWNNGAGCFLAMTAAINGSGNLQVNNWNFAVVDTFAVITPFSSATAGAASQVAIDAASFTGGPFGVTAVRNGSGNLSVEVWSSESKEIASYNTSTPIATVAVAAESNDSFPASGGNINHVVTAARTSAGDLEMRVWNYTPAP